MFAKCAPTKHAHDVQVFSFVWENATFLSTRLTECEFCLLLVLELQPHAEMLDLCHLLQQGRREIKKKKTITRRTETNLFFGSPLWIAKERYSDCSREGAHTVKKNCGDGVAIAKRMKGIQGEGGTEAGPFWIWG